MAHPRSGARPATYDDLLALPEHVIGEIIDGEYFTLAPDWICEVLSPGTARLDRQRKLAVYAREGVTHAWLLDPIERTLEVLRLEGQQWVIVAVYAGDEEVRAEPFAATSLPLARLWVD